MKKRRFNLKLGTVLTAVLCVLAAVMFWLFANYMEGASQTTCFIESVLVDAL